MLNNTGLHVIGGTSLPLINGNAKQIPLTQGYYALVDETDYDKLMIYDWYVSECGRCETKYYYAYARVEGCKVSMHRYLLSASVGEVIDHVNGNTLDNRRSNLRICSQADNIRYGRRRSTNTSGYKGVSKSGRFWRSYIVKDNKQHHLGVYSSKEEAARAYDVAAIRMFGSYACLNYLEG